MATDRHSLSNSVPRKEGNYTTCFLRRSREKPPKTHCPRCTFSQVSMQQSAGTSGDNLRRMIFSIFRMLQRLWDIAMPSSPSGLCDRWSPPVPPTLTEGMHVMWVRVQKMQSHICRDCRYRWSNGAENLI